MPGERTSQLRDLWEFTDHDQIRKSLRTTLWLSRLFSPDSLFSMQPSVSPKSISGSGFYGALYPILSSRYIFNRRLCSKQSFGRFERLDAGRKLFSVHLGSLEGEGPGYR